MEQIDDPVKCIALPQTPLSFYGRVETARKNGVLKDGSIQYWRTSEGQKSQIAFLKAKIKLYTDVD
ncbi:hypothetical protein [Burkholderia multivorans]|uniref:hypothetical protein n=1 Tax=Burkholderia multivorans TaxID=87883 RepID=UPI0021C07A57|nr:hypothetical protein [Burkholderia multivorans]